MLKRTVFDGPCQLSTFALSWLIFISSVGAEDKIYDKRSIRNITFSDPSYLKNMDENTVHIGTIMRILGDRDDFSQGFKDLVCDLYKQLLVISNDITQHWIIFTDKKSIKQTNTVIRNLVTKTVAEEPLRHWVPKSTIANIVIDYIDLDELKTIVEVDEIVSGLRSLYPASERAPDDKYGDYLFYICPALHLIFRNLDKIVMLDTDVKPSIHINQLWQFFHELKTPQVMALGLDLTPYYLKHLSEYKNHNPNSVYGSPGKFQGFNTGVVLYDLKAMRRSPLWKRMTKPKAAKKLAKKFMMPLSLGDQDFITLLGFEHPELFYILPCQYNKQTSAQFRFMPEFKDMFHLFRSCRKPWYIIHLNGCGPEAVHCGFPEDTVPGIEDIYIHREEQEKARLKREQEEAAAKIKEKEEPPTEDDGRKQVEEENSL